MLLFSTQLQEVRILDKVFCHNVSLPGGKGLAPLKQINMERLVCTADGFLCSAFTLGVEMVL